MHTINFTLSFEANFLPFHWPKAHHMTCEQLPSNKGLLMRNYVILLCLAANNILLMLERNHAPFSPFCDCSFVKMAASWRYLSKNKLAHWMIKQYYWTQLSKIIMICQCLTDKLFASAFGFWQITVHFTVTIQVETRLELTLFWYNPSSFIM